ncbi:MAG: NifX-associated nitrogen fixation protein [Methylicorpusculum sp.]|jgi:probable nitrogen fixation protein|uniref:NifX-associated nitrogen fixation protein n=1 Tax=Methylicorpusculum TaxID=2713642 RepID=UPI001357800B|nr:MULTISPECIES: NifX-associated nitrogen fixation protein [Methylicorpusculum]MBS3954095.1 NifX-associated nitrogen fixation protein [Methylomicrobium sp.]MCD2452663.1 NifX-associated nitrogen fixation protein [Methylicorpusculum oleiharenae]MDO8844456.1 NifX-associated nitrogen fixation protein [Methylicorpusculum sp.]MDO8940535.1 NifX-associated nitrogen fixation protein [Methylicorpusculum sp.]MDP2179065.1 NifX-associated nitrogen fixation protein [Methylicorpusculum sp.]
MSQAALVIEENDPYMSSDFVVEMLKQLRAVDTYDTFEGWPEEKIIDPLILTKERKREIPIVGDPDEITITRLKSYYNAIASLIEKKTGLMAVPFVNLTHEGFGRALIMVGKLIVTDKTLRDVHRWGFPSLEALCVESEKQIEKALAFIEKHKEVAEA